MSLPLYALQQLINALSIGSLYALMAVGLAMVFGILRLINFAHGDMMMVAAYIAAFALIAGIPLPIALLLMVVGHGADRHPDGAHRLPTDPLRAAGRRAADFVRRRANSPEQRAADLALRPAAGADRLPGD